MTDEQIIAYVDGELGPIEALRFERAAEADPFLAAQVARHRALRDRVAARYAPILDEPISDRLTSLLDKEPNVIRFPRLRSTPAFAFRRYGAIAATLAVGVMAGQLIPRADAPAVTERGGAIVAQAGLAHALQTQLASAGPADGYAIGVSFRNRIGDYCRTFSGNTASGIGCRRDDAWHIRQLVADESQPESTAYKQAGTPSPAVLQAAQDMMVGNPLDAAEEKSARDKDWK